MKPEHDRLFREVFDETGHSTGREETLKMGGRILRRRRVLRRTRQVLALFVILILPGAAVWRAAIQQNQRQVLTRSLPAAAARKEKIQILSDDQLLALFPNTPVALASVGGKKRLLFPRPGDEARYITRVEVPEPSL